MIHLLLTPALLLQVPRQPELRAFAVPGGILWAAWNAHTVGLDPGGEIPRYGYLPLPAGTYRLTAYGDRGLTASIVLEVR